MFAGIEAEKFASTEAFEADLLLQFALHGQQCGLAAIDAAARKEPPGHIGMADQKQPALAVLDHGMGAVRDRRDHGLCRKPGGQRQVLHKRTLP